MKKVPATILKVLIAAIIYLALFVLGAASGAIHPACFAYIGTFLPILISFIPFAFSFYAYSANWWTDTKGTLAAAVEEMPAGYADKAAAVIHNIPILIVMLVVTIPVAILGIWVAEKVLKRQAEKLQ